MEMRAEGDICMVQNVTPEIFPIAFSLSETFLLSHCSACFLPLQNPPQNPFLACNFHSSSPLRYCSRPCRDADADCHHLSGECHLIRSPLSPDSVSDIRTALRLLLSFERLGFLPLDRRRIGGLMTNREKFVGDEEVLARIREGGRAMAVARRMRDGVCSGSGEENEVEEAALCLVLTNAVEVQGCDGRAVGTAVYGPCFSWFNHSCRPNACYSFAVGSLENSGSGGFSFRVFPIGEEDTLKKWISEGGKLNYGPCKYGPRVIVRSIRPIRKGEEVCVAYMDLLQPKALRQSELWSKYRFVCCCERCRAQPPTYIDLCLQVRTGTLAGLKASSSCLDLDYSCGSDMCTELTDCLDQAMEHVVEGNPKACCEKLEMMLADSFQNRALKPDVQMLPNFQLQPLHHLSLNAYITLASAYRIRASGILELDAGNRDNQLEAFELSRAAAAYSLLLAGATHYLFSLDSSLIAYAAHFWVSSGEALLDLLQSPIWTSTTEKRFDEHSSLFHRKNGSRECMPLNNSKLDLVCYHLHTQKEGIISWDRFDMMCKGFMSCILRISAKVWPFLIHALPCLKDIKSPVDFRWLGMMIVTPQTVENQITNLATDIGFCSPSEEGSPHQLEPDNYVEREERMCVFQLATHGLLYGRYLASICYGPHCNLTG